MRNGFDSRTFMQKAAMCRLFAFFWLALCLVLPVPSGAAGPETVRARFIIDGDTFTTTDGRTVRLAAIDAPEIGCDGRPDEHYAAQARERLRALVFGKEVELVSDGSGRDRHGRILAHVILPEGGTAQEALVREGFAIVYPHDDNDPSRLGLLIAMQRQAILEGKGMWPRVLVSPFAEMSFLGNQASKRFGPVDCVVTRRISGGRRVDFPGLREAFWEGFAPYRECRSPFALQN